MKLFAAFGDQFHSEKEKIKTSNEFDRQKRPSRCGQESRQSERGRACVKNASNHDAKSRCDSGGASLRDTPAKNVCGIRSGGEI